MKKIFILLACLCLVGCSACKLPTVTDIGDEAIKEASIVNYVINTTKLDVSEAFVPVENADPSNLDVMVEIVYNGAFKVNITSYKITVDYYYTVYKDTETGYCFMVLCSGSIDRLLIPLVNAGGTYKEYLDSNTNVMTPVGTSQDKKIIIIKDEDTGVKYVFDTSMNTYFIQNVAMEE